MNDFTAAQPATSLTRLPTAQPRTPHLTDRPVPAVQLNGTDRGPSVRLSGTDRGSVVQLNGTDRGSGVRLDGTERDPVVQSSGTDRDSSVQLSGTARAPAVRLNRTDRDPAVQLGGTDRPCRVLLVGWFSFLHGEATAGDLLAWQAVRDELDRTALAHDTAWSPSFQPAGLSLEEARPADYTHLIFVCGPLHGPHVAELHDRFANCRRIAVGVSVLDPEDPAAAGFDTIIARDAPDSTPTLDLSAAPAAAAGAVPVVGVALSHGQGEYGVARRHERVNLQLETWLRQAALAAVPLDTRLDREDWTLARDPAQYLSVLRRMDAVVTTRLHGLALALANGVPALAIDPVAGGGKVTAQAAAWKWPIVLKPDSCCPAELDTALRWCLSGVGREAARTCATTVPALSAALQASPLAVLQRELRGAHGRSIEG